MALRSIHRPVRGPFAAAAACGWRRLLANQSSGLSEDDVERIVNKRMSEIFSRGYDPEGKELVRTIREIVKEEGDSMKPSQGVLKLVESTGLKRSVDMENKLCEQRIRLSTKMNSIQLTINRSQNDVKAKIQSFSTQCKNRAHTAALKAEIMDEKHKMFVEDLEYGKTASSGDKHC
ncbi:hypothetical protein EJB05_18705 [Eragrostis curvula]|uniref:Uncharacterized protein n=1 Tax=Eragrostis curvula TaxID=38414 RepID=A0A5J9VKI4_9POAL|nr:hypothetical protein EJB05_18705 [Eragrostis curvula]